MRKAILAVAGLAAAFGAGWAAAPEEARVDRFFELRKYTTHPGKLGDLHARFRDHTNRIFVDKGMQLVGYWTPADGDASKNTLIYILGYESREKREEAWKAFRSDPAWQKAFKASRENGPIVQKVESTLLVPTDYSPIR